MAEGARVLTLRKPSGEFLRKQAALPTCCRGVYRFPVQGECEDCWYVEEYGYCDGSCGQPPTWSWQMVVEAGVLLSNFSYEKPTVEEIAARLAETGIDFTLPLAEIVTVCRAPENAHLWAIANHTFLHESCVGSSAEPRG